MYVNILILLYVCINYEIKHEILNIFSLFQSNMPKVKNHPNAIKKSKKLKEIKCSLKHCNRKDTIDIGGDGLTLIHMHLCGPCSENSKLILQKKFKAKEHLPSLLDYKPSDSKVSRFLLAKYNGFLMANGKHTKIRKSLEVLKKLKNQ